MVEMSKTGPTSTDPVGWARRINGRWIVHRGLKETAEAYMVYLGRNDPVRLRQSCRNARRLASGCESAEDPKPWFYGGLFSLATPDEAREFLAGHNFTASLVPAARKLPQFDACLEGAGQSTWQTVIRIRRALGHLLETPEE